MWLFERLMPLNDSSFARTGGMRPQTLLDDSARSSTRPSFDFMPYTLP